MNTKIYPISKFFGGRYCSLSYGAKAPIPAGLSVFMGGWGLRPYRHVPVSRLFLSLQVNTLIKNGSQTSHKSQIQSKFISFEVLYQKSNWWRSRGFYVEIRAISLWMSEVTSLLVTSHDMTTGSARLKKSDNKNGVKGW